MFPCLTKVIRVSLKCYKKNLKFELNSECPNKLLRSYLKDSVTIIVTTETQTIFLVILN